jgi:hypothetical protein
MNALVGTDGAKREFFAKEDWISSDLYLCMAEV